MISISRFFIAIFFLFLFSFSSFSQDKIILKDNKVIECSIINFSKNFVNIKTYDNYSTEKQNIYFERIKDIEVGPGNKKFQLLNDTHMLMQEIRFRKYGLGTRLYIDDKKLTHAEIKALMFGNKNLINDYSSGKTLNITGIVIASIGGLATVGSLIAFFAPEGGEIMPIAISAGTAIIGVSLSYAGTKKVKRSVDDYNSELISNTSAKAFKIGINSSGFGIAFQF